MTQSEISTAATAWDITADSKQRGGLSAKVRFSPDSSGILLAWTSCGRWGCGGDAVASDAADG